MKEAEWQKARRKKMIERELVDRDELQRMGRIHFDNVLHRYVGALHYFSLTFYFFFLVL